LKPNDRISIVAFDDKSELVLAPKLIKNSRENIESAIKSLHVCGSTNISAGLTTTFNTMLNRKSKNQVTGIILLSDGQDNQYFNKGGAIVDNYFKEWSEKLKDHSYNIHTFGYGDDHDAELMDQIAHLNGGGFHYVNDVELVSESFADYLGGLCSVVGKNAFVDIKLNPTETYPEIRFKKTYGILFSGDKETQRKISLNNILKGYAKDFMFEVTLNASSDTDSIITECDFITEKLISAV